MQKRASNTQKDARHRENRSKMADINLTISVIILKVSGLNNLKGRDHHTELNMIKVYAVYRIRTFRFKDTNGLKVNRWKNMYHANSNQRKIALAILILDKVNFKTKMLLQKKEGNFIMIKNKTGIYNNNKHTCI